MSVYEFYRFKALVTLEQVNTTESSTDALVIISELVTRSDLSASGDVDAVNKRLRKFCNQRQWHFIRHDDIHSTDLNRGGLHLGETGIAKMYNNFANKLDECN